VFTRARYVINKKNDELFIAYFSKKINNGVRKVGAGRRPLVVFFDTMILHAVLTTVKI
jgi:hypothetical protein